MIAVKARTWKLHSLIGITPLGIPMDLNERAACGELVRDLDGYWVMVYPDVPGVSLASGYRAFVIVAAHGRSLVATHGVCVAAVFLLLSLLLLAGCERMKWLVG